MLTIFARRTRWRSEGLPVWRQGIHIIAHGTGCELALKHALQSKHIVHSLTLIGSGSSSERNKEILKVSDLLWQTLVIIKMTTNFKSDIGQTKANRESVFQMQHRRSLVLLLEMTGT